MASGRGRTGSVLRCCRLAGALSIALLLTGPPPVAGAAAAEPPDGGCPVVATAQGIQVMVSASDNILLAAPAGAGAPVAQSCVDYTVRDSTAFASSPYPGESGVLAPGLIGNQLGQEMPGYPAYTASRYPAREHARGDGPGYELRADSAETASNSRAQSALAPDEAGSAVSVAKSTVDPGAGTATAAATSDTQPLVIEDVLRIGNVHSTASAEVTSDGTLRRGSDLRIGHTTVGGQEVVITPDGVKAAGQNAPLPEAPPTDALEEAGITVRYLSAEQTRSGVLAAGVEVTVRHEDAETGSVSTVHYTLGRAFAAAAAPESAPDLSLPPPIAGSGPAPAGNAPPALPADGGPSGDDVALGPAPGDAPPPAASPPAGAPPAEVAAPRGLTANPVDVGATGLYLVLMLGGLVMAASGTLLRLLGVRTRWTW